MMLSRRNVLIAVVAVLLALGLGLGLYFGLQNNNKVVGPREVIQSFPAPKLLAAKTPAHPIKPPKVDTLHVGVVNGKNVDLAPGRGAKLSGPYTFQWKRCDSAGLNCVDIPGATSASYTLTTADVGHKLVVVATNGTQTGTSSPTATIGSAPTTGGGGGGTVTTPSPTLFISPSGSDSNNCTSSGTPCRSLQRAYSLAGPDVGIQMATGGYGDQALDTNNAAVTSGHPVVFFPPAGQPASAVVISHLHMGGANNVTFTGITIDPSGGSIAKTYYNIFSSNIVCDNCQVHGQVDIDGGSSTNSSLGSSNITFQNGQVCCYTAGNGDPQIGGFRGPTFTSQAMPTNVSFINERFHDIDSFDQATHTECLQILAVHGLTIKQSKFWSCNVHGNGSKNALQFSGYQCQNIRPNNEANCGTMNDFWNVTIENNFMDGGPSGSNQNPMASDDQFGDYQDCRSWVVRNNSMIGAVLWGCNNGGQNGGAAATVVTGNIFSYGTPDFKNSQCRATFSYTIWEFGGTGCGGSNVTTGDVGFVHPVNDASFDLHVGGGSLALGKANPSSFPSVDIDGDSRPIGSADAGADER